MNHKKKKSLRLEPDATTGNASNNDHIVAEPDAEVNGKYPINGHTADMLMEDGQAFQNKHIAKLRQRVEAAPKEPPVIEEPHAEEKVIDAIDALFNPTSD